MEMRGWMGRMGWMGVREWMDDFQTKRKRMVAFHLSRESDRPVQQSPKRLTQMDWTYSCGEECFCGKGGFDLWRDEGRGKR